MPELTPRFLVIGFIYYVVFLFSTTCHEASHSLVAKWGGDPTAALNGQVTLNPIPHIRREPWGMLIIPLMALLFMGQMIGWASAPFDPAWERRYPKRSALMALAGPATNFILMFVGGMGLRTLAWLQLPGEGVGFLVLTLFAMFNLNLLLGVFNLLPVAPLDGSTGIMIFMSESTAHRYLDWLRESGYARLGLLVGLLALRYFYAPIESFANNLLLHGHF
ncbi:MAG: site-2 protease family protein [Acidobacteria bacterium]|nr:site-2 protease family protein [Acidobacteriota bacterium]